MTETITEATALAHDPQHDFDFLFGSWKLRNRRLKEALTGSTEWLEFDATSVCRPIWNGAAHMDEYEALESPFGRIEGMTLRLFDAQSGQWTIYWANRKNGRLDTPMTGQWKDGRGEFYDQEFHRGRAIYVRFVWSRDGDDTARWEQAYSDDGGRTWETNWIMVFERVR